MNEPTPDPNQFKNHPPEDDARRMLSQVNSAFGGVFNLPWPRKPLGKPQQKGAGRPARTNQSRPRPAKIRQRKMDWGWD